MVAHLLKYLRQQLDLQLLLLRALDPNSFCWRLIAISRKNTLERYFDLLPHERELYSIEPKSVICIL